MVLRDKPEGAKRYQGALIPLEGNYLSGLRYGEANPIDEQVYLVGHDGSGTILFPTVAFAVLRYTGQLSIIRKPSVTYKNGIKLTFEKLISSIAETSKTFFAQQWNYKYSNAYGSPEYSVKNFKREGHDVLTVKASTY